MFAAEEGKRAWDKHLFSGNLGSMNLHFAAAGVWQVGACRLRAVLCSTCKEHPLPIPLLHKYHFAARFVPLGAKFILIRVLGSIESGRT